MASASQSLQEALNQLKLARAPYSKNKLTDFEKERALAEISRALAFAKEAMRQHSPSARSAYQIADQAFLIAQDIFQKIKKDTDLGDTAVAQKALQLAQFGCRSVDKTCDSAARDSLAKAEKSFQAIETQMQSIQSSFTAANVQKVRDAFAVARHNLANANRDLAMMRPMTGGAEIDAVFQAIREKTGALQTLLSSNDDSAPLVEEHVSEDGDPLELSDGDFDWSDGAPSISENGSSTDGSPKQISVSHVTQNQLETLVEDIYPHARKFLNYVDLAEYAATKIPEMIWTDKMRASIDPFLRKGLKHDGDADMLKYLETANFKEISDAIAALEMIDKYPAQQIILTDRSLFEPAAEQWQLLVDKNYTYTDRDRKNLIQKINNGQLGFWAQTDLEYLRKFKFRFDAYMLLLIASNPQAANKVITALLANRPVAEDAL